MSAGESKAVEPLILQVEQLRGDDHKQRHMDIEQLKAEHTALMKVFTHAGEFCKDWRKGDFLLPRLAALDAASLEEQLIAASSVMCKGENFLS